MDGELRLSAGVYKAPWPADVGGVYFPTLGLGTGNTARWHARALQRHCRWQEPQKRLSDVLSCALWPAPFSLPRWFRVCNVCATHSVMWRSSVLASDSKGGKHPFDSSGFRWCFFFVVVSLGRVHSPQISTKEPLFWSPQHWISLRQQACTGSCPWGPWTPCKDLVWPSTEMPLLRPPRSCTSRTATTSRSRCRRMIFLMIGRMSISCKSTPWIPKLQKLMVVPWMCVAVSWPWAHWSSAIAGLKKETVDPWAQIC